MSTRGFIAGGAAVVLAGTVALWPGARPPMSVTRVTLAWTPQATNDCVLECRAPDATQWTVCYLGQKTNVDLSFTNQPALLFRVGAVP